MERTKQELDTNELTEKKRSEPQAKLRLHEPYIVGGLSLVFIRLGRDRFSNNPRVQAVQA